MTVTFTVPAVEMSAVGIVATICVVVTDEGVIAGFAPKFTVAPVTKPVPVRVNVKAAPPTVAEVGAREVRVGAEAALIVNDTESGCAAAGRRIGDGDSCHTSSSDIGGGDGRGELRALTNVVVLVAPLNFTTCGDWPRAVDGESEGGASGSGTRWGEGGCRRGRIVDGENLSVDVPPPADS